MGRNRGFDTDVVLDAAGRLFGSRGYDATSVDDLVRELGIHRGSMYAAFGSKRGLFLAALARAADRGGRDREAQDLALVGLLELAPHDAEARRHLDRLVPQLFTAGAPAIGERLLARAGIQPDHHSQE